MTSRRSSRKGDSHREAGQKNDADIAGAGEIPAVEPAVPGTTGRYLVLMRQEEKASDSIKALTDTTGLKVASASDFEDSGVSASVLENAEVVFFDNLAVAVVNAPPEQIQALSVASYENNSILAVEPERVVYAITDAPNLGAPPLPNIGLTPPAPQSASNGNIPVDYLLGYRDAVNHLIEQVLRSGGIVTDGGLAAVPTQVNETDTTWGLQITRVIASRYTGRGVRVAVLDTGFDLGHPDFAGRRVVSQSFVNGQAVQDGHGHGTHCIGTACGSRRPGILPRYGIACDAEIYAGKVLSNAGSGTDSSILAGINWAISNNCAVISMSLGAPVAQGQPFSPVYETVARRALAAGTLIIAAAGNDSRRPAKILPVNHPANCPSILSVAAVDSSQQIAYFSCGGVNLQGGQVDIAGPGVDVYSSWPSPLLHRRISGTSMATPHVAGIAALYVEANPDVRGGALGWLLLQSALRLNLSGRDVGAGLVQAP